MTPTHSVKAIRRFAIDAVGQGRTGIVRDIVEQFGISRQAAARHLRTLVQQGVLESTGATRNRVYQLKTLREHDAGFDLTRSLEEDRVWTEHVAPYLEGVSENVLRICQYGFTEMLNNAIEHSEGSKVRITLRFTAFRIAIWVIDDGVGIFERIRQRFGLSEARHAILELAKGKLTTDPKNHTGQGIFFTSRMFDEFWLVAGRLYFGHNRDSDDWLIERRDAPTPGTAVNLEISPDSSRTPAEVFDRFAGAEDYGFSRTHVPIALAEFGEDSLVSRSQAKRVLSRFDRFREVLLDFKGVQSIGQAFADEIFRVFQQAHPQTRVFTDNETEQVAQMISRARAAENSGPASAPEPG